MHRALEIHGLFPWPRADAGHHPPRPPSMQIYFRGDLLDDYEVLEALHGARLMRRWGWAGTLYIYICVCIRVYIYIYIYLSLSLSIYIYLCVYIRDGELWWWALPVEFYNQISIVAVSPAVIALILAVHIPCTSFGRAGPTRRGRFDQSKASLEGAGRSFGYPYAIFPSKWGALKQLLEFPSRMMDDIHTLQHELFTYLCL